MSIAPAGRFGKVLKVVGPLVLASAAMVAAMSALGHSSKSPREAALGPPRFAREIDVSDFQKGNVHTHSSVSDGDVDPPVVYRWYEDHGYAFVALTDHNVLVDPQRYEERADPSLTRIRGEEITMDAAGHAVHVNALCISRKIDGGTFASAREALDHAVRSIEEQKGVALINHPNFDWGLDAEAIRETRRAQMLEVWSGHPYVRTQGRDGRPSHEALWDDALSAGVDLAPAGVDDAHHFSADVAEPPARPGQAFIEVFGTDRSEEALCARMRAGELYASNGATLSRLRVDADTLTVWPSDREAEVELVGEGGRSLGRAYTNTEGFVRYQLRGDEGYVRARVVDDDGRLAFTPAFRVISPSRTGGASP